MHEVTPYINARDAYDTTAVESGGLIPDVNRELRRAVVDAIRGAEPTSVLGVLISHGTPLTIEALAGLLGQPVGEVEWTVEMLEEEDLCARVIQRGLTKVVAFAAHNERNG